MSTSFVGGRSSIKLHGRQRWWRLYNDVLSGPLSDERWSLVSGTKADPLTHRRPVLLPCALCWLACLLIAMAVWSWPHRGILHISVFSQAIASEGWCPKGQGYVVLKMISGWVGSTREEVHLVASRQRVIIHWVWWRWPVGGLHWWWGPSGSPPSGLWLGRLDRAKYRFSVERWGGMVLIVSLCCPRQQEWYESRWWDMQHSGTPDARDSHTVSCCPQWPQILGRWLRPWPIVSVPYSSMGPKRQYACTVDGTSESHIRRRTCRTMHHSSLGNFRLPAGSSARDRSGIWGALGCIGPHGWGCCESSRRHPWCAIRMYLSLWLVKVRPLPELFDWEGAEWGRQNAIFDWTWILRRGYRLRWRRYRNLNGLPPAENFGPLCRLPGRLDTVSRYGS